MTEDDLDDGDGLDAFEGLLLGASLSVAGIVVITWGVWAVMAWLD